MIPLAPADLHRGLYNRSPCLHPSNRRNACPPRRFHLFFLLISVENMEEKQTTCVSPRRQEWEIEDDLVRAAIAGDPAAVEAFGHQLLRTAYIFTYSICSAKYSRLQLDRDNITGNVVLRALAHLEQFRFDCPYDKFLSRVVHNEICTEIRRMQCRMEGHLASNQDEQGRCVLQQALGGNSAAELNYRDGCRILADQINAIKNPLHREIIRLWISGYSYDEIAEEAGISSGGVGATIHRFKKQMRAVLGNILEPDRTS